MLDLHNESCKLFFIIIVTLPTKVCMQNQNFIVNTSTGQYVVQLETINPTIETFAATAGAKSLSIDLVKSAQKNLILSFIPGKSLILIH